jgi:1,4-dihydroxy-2-naphthoate octaprenyltransferase
LFLAVVLGFLGASVAWYESGPSGGMFNLGYAFLAGFGIVLAHIAVNAYNEYFDFKSGVDFRTPKTPFSGGSGALPGGLATARQAFWLATVALLIDVPIGVYFVIVKGWALMPLIIVAGVCIIIYTPFILKMGWPEWAPGLGLGLLPILGAYFVHTGQYAWTAFVAAVPPFILVHNLLLLNEFPDVQADRTVKRRTLPIVAGTRNAAVVYSMMTGFVYVWIVGAVAIGLMPAFALLALLTIPLAVKAIRGSFHFGDMAKLVPAMANNVFVVLLTQLLMGVGYILARVV